MWNKNYFGLAFVFGTFFLFSLQAQQPKPPGQEAPKQPAPAAEQVRPQESQPKKTIEEKKVEEKKISEGEALEKALKVAQNTLRTLVEVQKNYPPLEQIVTNELRGNGTVPWYQSYLMDMTAVVDQRLVRDQQNQTDLSKYPTALVNRLNRLLVFYNHAGPQEKLNEEFIAAHKAYRHTIVAVYVEIELIRRSYLYEKAPSFIDSLRERDKLVTEIRKLHQWTQYLLGWMHYIGENYAYDTLGLDKAFKEMPCWECTYGMFFHFGEENPLNFDQRSPIELTPYFYILLYPKLPRTVQPGALEKPGNGNTPALPKADDKEVQRLILQMQNLLKSPEVQADPRLKASIERKLKELWPNPSEPLKPLPPSDNPSPPDDKKEADPKKDKSFMVKYLKK